jgi:hypothetical protein
LHKVVTALGIALGWSASASATPAISFVGGSPSANGFSVTLGYSFTTGGAAINVDALGVFDAGADGLREFHDVAIFSADGASLLASARVDSGTGLPLDGGYRFASIAPLSLAASTTYLIGAFYSSTNLDAPYRRGTAVTTSGLTFGENRIWEGAKGLTAPTTIQHPDFREGYFGPSFRIAAVPEPSTWAMMILGMGAVGYAIRRRQKVTAKVRFA